MPKFKWEERGVNCAGIEPWRSEPVEAAVFFGGFSGSKQRSVYLVDSTSLRSL